MLKLILEISLFIFGWEYAIGYEPKPTEEKPDYDKRGVLWFIKYYGTQWLPKELHKPLFNCIMCMASFYGSLGYFYYLHITDITFNLITWVVVVVAAAGLNRLLKGISHLF